MAKKVWDTPIDPSNKVDWGVGDSTTGNLPLSGGVVQKYIQDNLDGKAGYFYSDETAGKCYVFASREDWETWHAAGNDIDSSLILATFGITANFSMEIDIAESEASKSTASGSTGNTITFSWNVKDKRDSSYTSEDANCYLTFINGTVTKTTSFRISGSTHTITQNIDEYLLDGENRITIMVTGLTSKVSGSRQITYKVINLGLTSDYDISQVWSINSILNVPYTLTGVDQTITEWWWDGSKLAYQDYDAWSIQNNIANRVKTLNLNSLTVADGETEVEVTSGVHSLQFRTYVVSNGVKFYTDTVYKDIIINNIGAELTSPVFAIDTIVPKKSFDPKKAIELYGMSQYVPYSFTLATYYPGDAASLATTITIDGMSTTYSQALENSKTVTLEIIPSINGDTTLTINGGGSNRVIPVSIEKNALGLSELTEEDGLVMSFSAEGRTNTSTNKDSWSYGDYTATFSGFEWTETSGWKDGQLLLGNGDSFTLDNYFPFGIESANGTTLELEYSTNRVLDDSEVLCSTRADSGAGFTITATEVTLYSIAQSISVKYKSGERVRIAFVVESRSASSKPLLLVYMNGILSGGAIWSSTDNITTTVPIKFAGSENASIALKQIRGYNRALTSEQILNNYILYRDTFAEMQTLYTKNDIYDDATGLISADKLAKFIPVMLITGDIPHVDNQGAEQKSDITIMPEVKYIDYIHNKSFVFKNAGMSCQGTSSMTYPKKNYRLYTEEKKLSKPTWPLNATWTYDQNHSGFFTMDIDDITNEQNWVEQPWSGKKDGKHKVKFAFRDQGEYENGEPMGATRWTIKADFAESSSTHNTGVARLWNNVMYNAAIGTTHPLRTHAQECAISENLGLDVRTCVDGFPIAMFYRTDSSSNYTFMGKYNFNNDKSSEEIFGFTDIDSFDDGVIDPATLRNGEYVTYSWEEENDNGEMELVTKECKKYKHTMQCWELTDSANPISLFKRTDQNLSDLTIADMGYEARYPDDAGEDAEDKRWRAFVQPFYEWMCDIRDAATITYDSNGDIETWTNPERFSTEKYTWMDVPKMAAYYIYLIRFGAVDQVVKNAMLTSEDGQHFYYINYDNDTILGLNNYGNLVFGPDITRTTKLTGATDFDYAARDSTLWNCLENDKEFMETIVPQIDEALRVAGLTYNNVVHTFEEEGGDQWCQTIYNKDSEYKYISSYRDGDNYLGSMQGARTTHRRWWVSTRFDFYDSKYHNGAYLSKQFIVNLLSPPAPYNKFKITAGAHSYYGLYADGTYSNRIELQTGEEAWITTQENVQLGRNNVVLSPHNLYEVDLTNCSAYVGKVVLNDAYDSILGSKMRRLVLGSSDCAANAQLKTDDFKGLASLKNLEYLNVQKYTTLTSIEGLDQLSYLKEFDARGSGLATVSFAKGAPLSRLALPEGIQTLSLSELPLLTTGGIYFDDGGYNKLTTLTIDNCTQLLDSWNWVNKFTNLKTINLQVNWGENSPIKWDDLVSFLKGKDGSLRGKIVLDSEGLPNEILEELYSGEYSKWFGEGCLEETNKLYVKLPKNIYLKLSKSTIIEGLDTDEGVTYLSWISVGFDAVPQVTIGTSSAYSSSFKINSLSDGRFEVKAIEGKFTADTKVTLYAFYTGGSSIIDVTVKNKVYPSISNTYIKGEDAIYMNSEGDTFELVYSDAVKGTPSNITWRIDTSEAGTQYMTLTGEGTQCKVMLADTADDEFRSMYNVTLYADIDNPDGETDVTISKSITISYSKGAIISESSNPELWKALERGLVTGFDTTTSRAFTKDDALRVTSSDFNPSLLYVTETSDDGETIITGVTTFNEFQYFTSISTDSTYLFSENPVLEEITLPGWTKVPEGIFYNCPALTTVHLDAGANGIEIGRVAFYRSSGLTTVDFGGNIVSIGGSAFQYCTSLKEINLTERLKTIGLQAFSGCTGLTEINLTDNIEDIGDNAFYNTRLKSIHIPNNSQYTEIGEYTFSFAHISDVVIPDNIKKIGNSAFSSCSVQTVDLGSVETIGSNAFNNCSISKLYLPKTLTSLESDAFTGNYGLKEYTGDSIFNPVKYSDTKQGSTYLISDPVTSQQGDETVTTYTLLSVASGATEFEFPSNITAIARNACSYGSCAEISIPNSITSIGTNAFYYNPSLTKVVLPLGTTSIPEGMFGWCTKLETVYVRSVTGEESAFNDLSPIKTVGSQAFYLCRKLGNLYFRDLTSVGNSAFTSCQMLGDLTVNNATPPSLGSNVFGDAFSSDSMIGSKSETKTLTVPANAGDAYSDSYCLWSQLLAKDYGFTLIELS